MEARAGADVAWAMSALEVVGKSELVGKVVGAGLEEEELDEEELEEEELDEEELKEEELDEDIVDARIGEQL